MFERDNTLLAAPFDLDSLKLTGPEVPPMSLRGEAVTCWERPRNVFSSGEPKSRFNPSAVQIDYPADLS